MRKSKKKNNEKNDEIQKWINRIVLVTLAIVLPILYVYKQVMLKESGITICKIIIKRREPGGGFARGKQTIVEYFVNGKRYETSDFNSNPYSIGDCFKIEYGLKDPQMSNILWDEGKQPCLSE